MRVARLGVLLFGLYAACATEQPGGVSTPGSGGGSGAPGSGGTGTAGTLGSGGAGGTGAAGTSGVAGTVGAGGVSGVGGSGGTGGSASGGRGGGAAGRGGSGAAGTTGGTGGGAGGVAGAAGGAGIGGPSLCTPGKYVICEDFEATAVGAIPTGWTKSGAVGVAADQAARGAHSLKVSPAINGARRINGSTSGLGSGHWGRVFYNVQSPAPISCDPSNTVLHSTFVALQGVGPVNGAEEVRVVDTVENAQGMHQWLYNVQPSGNEFGKGSAYSWKYDGLWHCAEWHIDNPTQSYHFYLDGAEVTSIAINNGAGNYNGSDIPPSFSQVRIGVYNYQQACSPYLTVWLDELAMDPNRIGCGN